MHFISPLLVSFQNFWEMINFLHLSRKLVVIFLTETRWHGHTQFWIEQ